MNSCHLKGVILGSLALLLLVMPHAHAQYGGGTGEPNNPYQIATAADLILLGETPDDYDKHFILTADIDLSDWTFDKSVIAGGPFDIISGRGTGRGTGRGPIEGSFTGNVDGQGFVVRKLRISPRSWYTGLFGYVGIGGVVSNLILEDVSVDSCADAASAYCGGLSTQNAGTIINCRITGWFCGSQRIGGLSAGNTGLIANCGADVRIQGTGARVGGLVGANYGSITRSYCLGSVSGEAKVGGLVGENGGIISSSYSTCLVRAEMVDSGGLVGLNEGAVHDCQSHGSAQAVAMVGGLVGSNAGHITSSYSTAQIMGEHWIGGLVGSDKGNSIVSFWDTQTSGLSHSDGGVGLSTAEMQDPNTYLDAGWDFIGETENGTNDIWKIVEGQTYPLLSWQKYGGGTGEPNDPYLLYTAEHLNDMGADTNDYDKHFRLMADIDLSEYTYNGAVIAPDINENVLLSYQGNPFFGVFDGNGKTISNLEITGKNYLGLIGKVESTGEVKNLGLIETRVSGTGYFIGGVAGACKGRIVYCHHSGSVKGRYSIGGLVGGTDLGCDIVACYSQGAVEGEGHVGGIVGTMIYGRMSECQNNKVVYGKHIVGGLAGCIVQEDAFITTSDNSGLVTGETDIGGIVGSMSCGEISNCSNTGEIVGEGSVGGLVGVFHFGGINTSKSTAIIHGKSHVGGLVGWMYRPSYVANCHCAGTVHGEDAVGGLLGSSHGGIMAKCYSTSVVEGETRVGGGVGRFDGSVGRGPISPSDCITESYWDIEASGQSESVGCIGLMTAEMQTVSTFLEAGWDFIGETDNGTEDIWWIDEGQGYPRLWWESSPEE